MSEETTSSAIPRFPRGVRLHFDEARNRWILLAPERVLEPDQVGLAILERIDGQASLREIVDRLAAVFDAPRERIATDVEAFLRDLADKGLLELAP